VLQSYNAKWELLPELMRRPCCPDSPHRVPITVMIGVSLIVSSLLERMCRGIAFASN
jgi:hypothetical protein